MFDNVVVGVDGHGGGADAIALSKRLLEQGGQLTFAHVYSGDAHTRPGAPADDDLVKRERIAEVLETARTEAGVEQADLSWRGASSAGRGLHEVCELIDADLLVVGSSRRGLFGLVLLGDDTHAALNGAPCAIAVAPAGYAEQPGAISEIGVAYDGSPESEHALAVARTLATEHEAKLSAREVVSLPGYALLGGGAPVGDAINGLVEDARARLAALDGVEPHAVYGIPAQELSLYSVSLDLLVVGSRGYGPLGRLMHGSTSRQLARTARCPLLVLPRTAPTRAAMTEHEPASTTTGQQAAQPATPPADAREGRDRRGQGRADRVGGFPEGPREVPAVGWTDPARGAVDRTAGDGQDAARQGAGGGGAAAVLLDLGLGVRRAVRRGGRLAGARSFPAGQGGGAGDHLHR